MTMFLFNFNIGLETYVAHNLSFTFPIFVIQSRALPGN